jgi:PAS domain-containing protein
MKKNDLRQQAEAKLSKRKKSPATDKDTLRLIHELEVHQIELEMQNEELAQAHAELKSTLSQYAELYAFASVGYFTLTRDGTIRRANLTGAKLMGVGLNEMIKRRFALFVSPESRLSAPSLIKYLQVAAKRSAKSPLRRMDQLHSGCRSKLSLTLRTDRMDCAMPS